jgi:hypothetical protein
MRVDDPGNGLVRDPGRSGDVPDADRTGPAAPAGVRVRAAGGVLRRGLLSAVLFPCVTGHNHVRIVSGHNSAVKAFSVTN